MATPTLLSLPRGLTFPASQHTLVAAVAAAYGISAAELRCSRVYPDLVRMRWVVMALLARRGVPQARIAALVGRRDRKTVQHGLRRIAASPDLQQQVARLDAALRGQP